MSSEDVATDIGQSVAESIPAQAEKMVPQSEVDKIVGARLARERAQMQSQQGMGGMQSQGYDEEALLAKAQSRMQETFEKQRQEAEFAAHQKQVDEVARQYVERMKQGPELYEDFKEVTQNYNPAAFPQVTLLAAQQDNLPDIMYELSKNPGKLAHLHVLALADREMARAEITKLSKSIKRNEEAVANNVKSPSPLSRLKGSTIAGSDTGKRTVSDLRKDARFKV